MLSDKPDSMNPSLPAQSPYKRTRAPVAPFVTTLFVAAVFASGCVIHDHGRGGHYAGPVAVQPRVAVAVPAPVVFTFTDHHKHSAQNYYHEHPRHHGNKHKWKKKWKHKRKSHLHTGIQMQVIPIGLARQLPPAPRGTQYIYDADQVLLVDVNTRVVLDFINISMSVEPQVVAVPAPVVFTFNDHHRHSVRNYYHEHPNHHGKKHKKHKWKKKHKNKGRGHGGDHLPPGLAKRDVLPPGIQMQALPGDLIHQLPHPPHGTRYTYHEDQVLLIDLNTRVVLDFINISIEF